jgi:RNA-binding protein YlmH
MAHDPIFLRRAEELAQRSQTKNIITHTGFLTPAEQHTLESLPSLRAGLLFHGGGPDCERRVAFFLPPYMAAEDFAPQDYITAFHIRCRFGAPGHRDVLGSLLGFVFKGTAPGEIYTG